MSPSGRVSAVLFLLILLIPWTWGAPVAGFCKATSRGATSADRIHLANSTSRATSTDPDALTLSEEKSVSEGLFGTARDITFHEENLIPYSHPRILFHRKEWQRILMQYADHSILKKKGTWANFFFAFSIKTGPLSGVIKKLSKLHSSQLTSLYDGRMYQQTFEYESYRQRLKPLADYIGLMDGQQSKAFFICAFWTANEDKVAVDALPPGLRRRCIRATVAWANILLAHRAYYCNPDCPDVRRDPDRTFLWNSKRAWEASDDYFTAGSSIALAYDVMYEGMSPDERKIVRSAIAMLVLNRFSWGNSEATSRNFPNAATDPNRIFSYKAIYHSNLYLTNLAIEGEQNFDTYSAHVLQTERSNGFNQGLNERFSALIDAYMSRAIYPDGSTLEDGHTLFFAMGEGALSLIAHHVRGSGILDNPRFRNFIYSTAQMFEPWRCGKFMGHRGGRGNLYNSYVGLFKYMYPQGELPAMLWRQRFGTYENYKPCRIEWWQAMVQLAILGGEHTTEAESPEGLSEDAKKHFGLSLLAKRRGLVVARGSFAEDSSYLHFDARPDPFLLGYDNADRGIVTFSALGQTWIDDLPWYKNSASKKHSLLHVDGIAQGEKAPPVKMVRVSDNGKMILGVGDLTYAYNIQWAPGWNYRKPPLRRVAVYKNGIESFDFVRFNDVEDSTPWELGWPLDDDAMDLGFSNSTVLHGIDDIGSKGLWNWKRTYRKQPLRHMVRTIGLIRSQRGAPGFVFLVDSVDAGPGVHSFESYLILNAAVEVSEGHSYCGEKFCHIILIGTDGKYVRVTVFTKSISVYFSVESLEEGAKRLIIGTRANEREEFWIGLQPAHQGESESLSMRYMEGKGMMLTFEGRDYRFGIDKNDHGVSGSYFAPMEPIDLKPWVAHGIEHGSLIGDSKSFLFGVAEEFQIVFRFHSLSSASGQDVDELRTCSWYTTMATKIAIHDCGGGKNSGVNYQSRNCKVLSEDDHKHEQCSHGSHQAKWTGRLKPQYTYFATVSGNAVGNMMPRFSIVHFRRRLRLPLK